MNIDPRPLLNPKDDLSENDYGQRLKDAGYDGNNKPTPEEAVNAMPPAKEPKPIRGNFFIGVFWFVFFAALAVGAVLLMNWFIYLLYSFHYL